VLVAAPLFRKEKRKGKRSPANVVEFLLKSKAVIAELVWRKFKLKRFAFVVGVIIVCLGLGLLWWRFSLTPVDPKNTSSVAFVVEKGDGVREIANKLHQKGLIRDSIGFFLLVKKLGIEKNIQAGEFKLSPAWEANEIARKLTLGTEDLWVTIPEGLRSEEILEILEKINPSTWTVEDEKMWKADEGKLFPETYRIPKGMELAKVHDLLIATFNEKVTEKMRTDGEKNGLKFPQVLTLASLVEREVSRPKDRAVVAGILYNRLENGMRLDIDASTQYAIGYTAQNGWWKKELTDQDLQFKSLFNTRLNGGLPPGPICNPGIEAIKAAIYPEKTDYLYYLSDAKGVTHFAKTLSEHNANVAKFLK